MSGTYVWSQLYRYTYYSLLVNQVSRGVWKLISWNNKHGDQANLNESNLIWAGLNQNWIYIYIGIYNSTYIYRYIYISIHIYISHIYIYITYIYKELAGFLVFSCHGGFILLLLLGHLFSRVLAAVGRMLCWNCWIKIWLKYQNF